MVALVSRKLAQWADYTPTVSSGSGTLTTTTVNSARYALLENNLVAISVDFTLTDAGTGINDLLVTLPANGSSAAALNCYENDAVGAIMVARVRPADLTKVSIALHDNTGTAIATGRRFIITGIYEAA